MGARAQTDGEQTIYVWLDALINYLTAAGFADRHISYGILVMAY